MVFLGHYQCSGLRICLPLNVFEFTFEAFLVHDVMMTFVTLTHALMPRDGLAKKNSRVALKSATREFCSVPVQGFGGPRGTPHVPRVRLH